MRDMFKAIDAVLRTHPDVGELVGWVEHLRNPSYAADNRMMGFAALNPSYGLISMRGARCQPVFCSGAGATI
jgi:hypothetical protein